MTLRLKYKLVTLIFGRELGIILFLMHMLSVRISSWRVRSKHASVPDAYAQHVLKELGTALSARINS